VGGLRSRATPLRNHRDRYLVIDRSPASSGQVAHMLGVRPHFEVRVTTEFTLDFFDDFLKQHPRAFAIVGRVKDGCATVLEHRDLAIRPAAKFLEKVYPAAPGHEDR
jgi:hypothetical protein